MKSAGIVEAKVLGNCSMILYDV